jgi:transcriptional regulator with XRE-family HTH domain
MTRSAFTDRADSLRRTLIAARKEAGITQAQLAKALRRPQSFISKYERGERRLDVIEFLEVTEVIGADPIRIIKALGRV